MSGWKAAGAGKARQGKARVIHVSPLARAVQIAFAASLALAGSGVAFAGTCTLPASGSVECTSVSTDSSARQDVPDLTQVSGPESVPTSVTTGAFGVDVVSSGPGLASFADITNGSGVGATAFSVDIVNSGPITKSGSGDVIGIDADFAGADISIVNRATGVIDVESVDGLADGIFAGGDSVSVKNQGTIEADGFDWAAGIEAEGYDLTTVTNSGDISATATANDETSAIYGQAFGIYATGGEGGVKVNNKGTVTADGVFATGVFTQAGGPITVTNTGDITVGSNPALITYYGTGIHASNAYENSAVEVTNRGDLSVYGYFGSTGIEAGATGDGSTVSVTNNGTIAMTGSYGTGILASGDGDTSITNGGSISSLLGDGAVALAFNGTASVTNSGDISAYVYGITASSQNGAGYVNNSGTVETSAAVQTFGIYVGGGTGATVINTGSVTAGVASAATQYSSKYSNGIFTHASLGDTSVSNSGAVVTEGGKYGRGILAIASQGDVAVTNAAGGSLAVNQGKYANQQVGTGVASLGYGIQGVSYQGDVSIDNAGSVTVASTRSFGLFGLSGAGNVSVSNSGTVDVYGFVKQIGVQAQAIGGNATVDNSGTITASATGNYAFPENNKAFGIVAYASGGDVNVSNDGTITAATGTGEIIDPATYYVIPAGDAVGISATSPDGNISVSNTGTITATSNSGEATALDRYGNVAVAGNALGIYAAGTAGDTSVSNDGSISATSTYGLADGIFATGTHVTVTNGAIGSITANGFNWAAGIEAQGYDLTTVVNNGDISAVATANDEEAQVYGQAFGLYASGGEGGVKVNNKGTITADGVFATGVLAQGGGPITIRNTGDITIGGSEALTSYYSTGIQASNNYTDSAIKVNNRGTIAATGDFGAKGIAATATGEGSAASVTNAGGVSAISAGSDYSNGTGIFASGDAGATVRNTVDGVVFASGNGYAYGVQALTFNGDANVVNNGDLTASADGNAKYSAYAVGVLASSLNGNAVVNNTGSISANAASQASAVSRGIYATGVAADVVNSGTITTDGGNSLGIGAVGSTGDVTVLNQGSIHATGNKYSSGTGISVASTYGDVNLTNGSDGNIVALGSFGANGMQARSFYGDVNIVNAGSIEVGSSDPSTLNQPNAIGIYAGSRTGNVSVVNRGTILAQTASNPTGIHTITTGDGTTTVDNSGTIQAIGQGVSVWGVYTQAYGGGDIAVHNSGTIEASTGAFHARGIWGCAGTYDFYAGGCTATGDISVVNGGTITAFSRGDDPSYTGGLSGSRASGIWVYGDHTDVANRGSITADGFAWASGIEANGTGQTLVTNSGDISVSATANDATNRIYGQAFGIKATGGAGGVSVTNRGAISAASVASATGIDGAVVGGDLVLRNRGTIAASTTSGGDDAIGINGIVSGGDLTLANTATGSITATSVDGDAIGMQGTLTDADVTIKNAGSISASSANGTSYAIRLLDGEATLAPANATISNSGTLHGAIVTGAGNDTLSNLRGGTWEVRGDASDFGAGNDSFTNAAGARLVLFDAGISFGAGNNRFTNAGTIHVSGNNTIDMTDGGAQDIAAALARPKGTASFTNNGVIDMLDGAADDSLTITGSFGGSGAINFDVSLLDKRNDQLFVQGGVLNGSRQRVNVVLLDGLPTASDVGTTLELVHVSGDTNPSVFVGGDVLGISSRDFLSMGLKLSSKPDKGVSAGDGSSYMLSVKTYVKGLSASGVLASSAALGVDSLMTSGTGSWRERQYALQAMGDKPVFASITPWVRGFNDEGGMSPNHLMASFGQMSSSRVSQDNSGTEVGMEFQGTHGLRFGTVFGKSEATQSLVSEYGRNTIRGNTMGLYATWLGQNGLYVDTSWRTMKFEAAIGSGGLYQRNNGNAYSANLEAGYAWTLDNGLNIEPKLQYTSTTIDGMQVQGDEATFRSEQARWNRGQAGFSFSKRYGGGSGWRVTPYGELSMLRTFDGVANYSINQDYFGDVMTEGTSALVKLGLGAQKGRFSLSGGVNWMDGAAYDSVFGGQMTVGYSW